MNLAFLKLDGTELKNQRVSPMPQVWCKGEFTFLGKMKGEDKRQDSPFEEKRCDR